MLGEAGSTCQHSGGRVVLVFFAMIIGAMGIGVAAPSFAALSAARVSAYKLFKVVDRKVSIDISDTSKPSIASTGARDIVFSNVTFRYPSKPDTDVLKGFNLTIPAGKTVALVVRHACCVVALCIALHLVSPALRAVPQGPSGCGKSTVVSLLQRFYDTTAGSIHVGGQDIKSCSVRRYGFSRPSNIGAIMSAQRHSLQPQPAT